MRLVLPAISPRQLPYVSSPVEKGKNLSTTELRSSQPILKIMNTKLAYSSEKPPMYDVCHKYFGADWDKGTVFAYKNTIHAKHISQITKDLEVHEMVHLEQQERLGDADIWWDKYLSDANFRKEQEIEAYKAQLVYSEKNYNHGYRKALRKHCIESLAGLSGGSISLDEAEHLLTV